MGGMETLAIDIEIRLFLQRTGLRQTVLAHEAGVPDTTVSNLIRGVRRDVRSRTADALRTAMKRLENRLAQDEAKADGFTLP
jgi:predicted XRE-type DNA-binding protein